MDGVWGGGGGNHVRCRLLTKDDVVFWMMLHGWCVGGWGGGVITFVVDC